MNKGILGACATVGAALSLAACAGSRPAMAPVTAHRKAHARPICSSAALDAMARFLRVPPATISTATSTGNNGMPQCTYAVRLPLGKHMSVTANVDTSPSPYAVLERTIEEAAQIFGPARLSPAPVTVPGLGLDAAWFPDVSSAARRFMSVVSEALFGPVAWLSHAPVARLDRVTKAERREPRDDPKPADQGPPRSRASTS
jgi:hypothetical protein